MVIDTVSGSSFVPQDAIQKTKLPAQQVIGGRYLSLLMLARMMGIMISNLDALQWGRFHTRPLQRLLRLFQMRILQKQDTSVHVLVSVKNSLLWWTKDTNLHWGRSM